MTDDRPIMESQVPNDPVRNAPKFSRYKSVRRAAAAAAEQQQQQQQQNAQASSPAVKPKSETIARSMSRYRRPRTATTGTAAIDSPAVPAIPPSQHIVSPANKTWYGMKSDKAPACPSIGSKSTAHTASQRGSKEDEEEHRQQDEEEEEELSAAEKARLREEAMRTLTMAEGPPRTASARAPAPAVSGSRDLIEQNRRLKPEGEVGHQRRASWKERLGLSRQKTSADPLHRSHANEASVEPSGKGIVAGIDAPLSAVNAGERRVLIRYQSASLDLPVTPTTRAKDLISSAVKCFSEYIDPQTAIIVETFSSLGLERPIRRYEHIRDVLNSWATDDANSLIVCESPQKGAHERLELKAAPSGQPADSTFYLYYSSKPGKWDKRHVTLRADGQVVVSKKPNAKEAKDFTNICHISDFDIYTPTIRQISKKLKPPKKICFAIKSQQKSSMFLSTENFVHFFATNDSDVAQGWHDAVHGWRSWYLAHVVKLDEKYQEVMRNQKTVTPTDSHGPPIPHQLNTKPLVDLGRNVDVDEKAPESTKSPTSTRDMFLRSKKAREKAPPPSAFQSSLPNVDVANKSVASEQDDDSTFLPDSLLGRAYSQRQAAQREREAREALDNEPFTPHGLLKNMSPLSPIQSSNAIVGPSVHHTIRSPTQSEGVSQSRSSSVRHKPKPLVDLTPVYQEPPQHARKGHGVRIEPGRPLVEGATGLETIPGVPDIPPATTWKREQVRPVTAESSAASIAPRRGNTVKSISHRDFTTSSTSPFVPNGLLAQSGNSASYIQTKTGGGRGVATGHRDATRPLLDLTPTSEFVEGSLLRNMERQHATIFQFMSILVKFAVAEFLILIALFPDFFIGRLPNLILSPFSLFPSPPPPASNPIPQQASTMSWFQKQFTLPSRSRGSYLITDTILNELPEIRDYRVGLLTLFVQHTSCALSLNENWDEDVRADMSDALDRIVPYDKKGNLYRHSAEGEDDMPAHVKSALVGASVTIPITNGRLATGTWQGIWFLEFRASRHTRKVVATIQGEKN